MIKDLGDSITPIVQGIIEDHHELYSGQGFIKGLKGFQIDERVQVVSLADRVEDLMSGRMTGAEMSPVEAFQWLKEKQHAGTDQLFVSPEIFESIYQIVMNTKPKDFEKAA